MNQPVQQSSDQFPERIWLQTLDGEKPRFIDECTWCAESIYSNDVEYVRADLAATQVVADQPSKSTEWDVVPQPWLALYAAVNYVVAQIGMNGQVDSSDDCVDVLMSELHDIDNGVVSERALELHEKACMPLLKALKLAHEECGDPVPDLSASNAGKASSEVALWQWRSDSDSSWMNCDEATAKRKVGMYAGAEMRALAVISSTPAITPEKQS